MISLEFFFFYLYSLNQEGNDINPRQNKDLCAGDVIIYLAPTALLDTSIHNLPTIFSIGN